MIKLKLNYKAIIFFIIAIAITYLGIYFLSRGDFFKSPMYMILPIVGFLGMFFTAKYIMDFMHMKNKYYFGIIFLVVGIIAYYLAIIFFYWNIILLNNIPSSELFKFIFANYNLFLTSAFTYFLVAGFFGIIAIDN